MTQDSARRQPVYADRSEEARRARHAVLRRLDVTNEVVMFERRGQQNEGDSAIPARFSTRGRRFLDLSDINLN
jgi:hypothetical protein